MSKHETLANRFSTIMEKSGASVSLTRAETGTIYVTVNGLFKARFADHGECYCREDISVDPDGCSLEQAVAAVGRELGINVTDALNAMNRTAKAAQTRKTNAATRFETKMARREAAVTRYMSANPSASKMDALRATESEWA